MGQAPRSLTPHRSLWDYLGSELRWWRLRAGLSLDELGARVHFSGDLIGRVEKAERSVNSVLVEACDRELGAEGALVRFLALAEAADRTAPPKLADVPAAGRDGAPAGPGWLPLLAPDGTPDALSRALTRREVSGSTVATLTDLVAVLRRLDDEVGPGRLVGSVTANLGWVSQLLGEADHRGAGFAGLCSVAAELSQLAGWLSFDLNRSGEALGHLRAAHQAAEAAGDHALAAYTLGWRSIVAGQTDVAAGLALARSARRQAGADVAGSVDAWVSRVEAEALAAGGDRRGAEQALERVERAAARPRDERDPAFTYFIDAGQIAAYRGVAYVRLGDGLRAEAPLAAALDGLQPSFVRDRALYLTYLAAAHALQRRPEEAAGVAADALALASATQSPRSVQRIATLRRQLEPWASLPAVRDLGDRLHAG